MRMRMNMRDYSRFASCRQVSESCKQWGRDKQDLCQRSGWGPTTAFSKDSKQKMKKWRKLKYLANT